MAEGAFGPRIAAEPGVAQGVERRAFGPRKVEPGMAQTVERASGPQTAAGSEVAQKVGEGALKDPH